MYAEPQPPAFWVAQIRKQSLRSLIGRLRKFALWKGDYMSPFRLASCAVTGALAALILCTPNLGLAQQASELAGDYTGMLGPYHVKLHLTVGRDGKLSGTADNPDAGLTGLQCTNFNINGQALSFTVPMVQGTWSGVAVGNGTTLSGMWSQGMTPVPLNFTRVSAANEAGGATATAGAATGTATVSRISSTNYGSMVMTQDDVTYDGSDFKVSSVNGVPRSVVEMRPGGQFITSTIMPNGRVMSYPASNDPSYADRIQAVVRIDAAGPTTANSPTVAAGNSPAVAPSTTAASVPPSSSAPGGVSDAQPGLQGYEGSLGSLGDAKILLPGDSVQTPGGTLKNAGDSTRVIVYFTRTQEKVSFSSGKSSDHKDDVVVLAGDFGSTRRSAYSARTVGSEPTPQYTEYLIHFTGGNSNMKHAVLGGLKADTVDRARPGSSALGTNSQAHTASFTISTVDANGHVHESLSSRQVDDWMNTTAYSRGLGVDKNVARAAGLAVVADRALEDQGKENPELRHVKKEYGLGTAMQADLDYFAFGAGGLDKPGAQEKRDQRLGATAGALGTTTPSPQ